MLLTRIDTKANLQYRSRGLLRRRLPIVVGGALLSATVLAALLAPWLGTIDPELLVPARRLRPPSELHWFGTDALGRDIYSRVLFGARTSLVVGICVAILAIGCGTALGILAGFSRPIDRVLMRFMDGLMAIPAVLLAIALMALTRASVENVIVAIAVTEIPRVTRLVRAIVLQLREQPFIEAAIACGTSTPRILVRHILPNTFAPMTVQATFICASAILTEAILSFIGAGGPSTVPTWGSIIADGRSAFQIRPHLIIFPSIFLSLTILSINLLGDGLRDALDPRLARQM